MEITQLYRPNSNIRLTFYKKIDLSFASSEEILKFRNQDETDNLPVGISDCAKQNSAYRNLIELANISKYSNEEILEEWMRKDLKILTWRNSSLLLTADRPSSEQEYSPTDRQILNYKFINKLSLKSIASLMNWAVEDVKKTIDNFYKWLKDSKSEEEWKQELKKKEKIEKDTQDIKDYVKQNSGKILTILSIKSYFDSARQEDDKITLYRIRKTMKVEMGYTFKKASIINKVMILSDRKRKIFESAMIQLYIHEATEEVIYLDEASCSQRN